MAFVPVERTAKVAVEGRMFGKEVITTLHFQRDDAPDASSLSTLADNVSVWHQLRILPHLSESFQLEQIVATSLHVIDGPQVVSIVTQPAFGGYTNVALPGQNALCVKFLTGLTGRRNRGRNYISGLPELEVTANHVHAPYAELLRVGYQGLLPLGDVDPPWRWSHVSYTYVDVVVNGKTRRRRNGLRAVLPITTVDLSDYRIDSQRRRSSSSST